MFPKKSLVNIFLSLALLLAISISFCGCKEERVVTPVSPHTDMITFTDDLKRQVSVPAGTKDAVVLVGSLADIWNLSGGNITATVKDSWEDFSLDIPDAVNLGTVVEAIGQIGTAVP